VNYLKLAQVYVDERNDTDWFSLHYTNAREWFNVQDSVYKVLTFLYNENVAKKLLELSKKS